MPSFICDECQATLKKAKVSSHSWQCSSRAFSCIDCSQSFNPQTVNAHTSCISEAEKYQGHLYKGNKQKQRQTGPPSAPAASAHSSLPPAAANDSEERAKKRSRVEEETKEETPLLSTDSTDVATALTAVLEETVSAVTRQRCRGVAKGSGSLISPLGSTLLSTLLYVSRRRCRGRHCSAAWLRGAGGTGRKWRTTSGRRCGSRGSE